MITIKLSVKLVFLRHQLREFRLDETVEVDTWLNTNQIVVVLYVVLITIKH